MIIGKSFLVCNKRLGFFRSKFVLFQRVYLLILCMFWMSHVLNFRFCVSIVFFLISFQCDDHWENCYCFFNFVTAIENEFFEPKNLYIETHCNFTTLYVLLRQVWARVCVENSTKIREKGRENQLKGENRLDQCQM